MSGQRGAGGFFVQEQNGPDRAPKTKVSHLSPVLYFQVLCSHRWVLVENCPIHLPLSVAFSRDIVSHETAHCSLCKLSYALQNICICELHCGHFGDQNSSPTHSQMPTGPATAEHHWEARGSNKSRMTYGVNLKWGLYVTSRDTLSLELIRTFLLLFINA